MDQIRLADQIMKTVDNMIDPHATMEQQLCQMRAQLEALSQLPYLIQQKVESVTRQMNQISQMQSYKEVRQERIVEIQKPQEKIIQFERYPEELKQTVEITELEENGTARIEPDVHVIQPSLIEESTFLKKPENKRIPENNFKKQEVVHPIKCDQEPKVELRNKPKPAFGPAPQERPLIPGVRKWRKSTQEYDEESIQETLAAQAEVIKGNAIGVNFMKYQKPAPGLDHLKNSEVFKAIHNMDEPVKKVELLRPVIAEADYRERARSMSPLPHGR